MKKIVIPLILFVLFSGCAKKQDVLVLSERLDALEKDLGAYRYGALEPKVRLTLLTEKFEKLKTKYGAPKYHFSGIAAYCNEYPIDSIGVDVFYELNFRENYVDEDSFSFFIKGDSTVFDTYAYMTDIPNVLASVEPEFVVTDATCFLRVEALVELERR